jgi:hypothetical protein
MRARQLCLLLLLVLVGTIPALAELQNVEVGGEVRLRGNHIDDTFTPVPLFEVRWPATVLGLRPIGGPFAAGGNNGLGVVSTRDWDDQGNAMKFVEQRTRLHLLADFTDNVSAMVEFDHYGMWGENFRSDYITGMDRSVGSDVGLFQAYVEANEMFGQPLRLRVGRQELAFGNQWLVGPRDFEFFFTGLSFDGVRLTYDTDLFTVDTWWSKLAERSPLEQDGDTDFYGVYGTYKGIENLTLDAYWMAIRDAESLADVYGGPVVEWLEELVRIDDYDVQQLHTVGGRAAGHYGAVDFNAELAYQFGNADKIGFTFKPRIYGNGADEFDVFGGNAEIGYTLDVAMHPRVFAGLIYMGGEDNRDMSFAEWLNPIYRPDASISFNRLFSNVIYSGFMDLNNDLSNCYIIRGGVMFAPCEKISAILMASDFTAVEPFDAPMHITIGRQRFALFPGLPFLTTENDDHLGLEVALFTRYQYSEDLVFEAGWAHMFTDDGLEEGSFSAQNGLVFNGGTDGEDADYIYLGSRLSF